MPTSRDEQWIGQPGFEASTVGSGRGRPWHLPSSQTPTPQQPPHDPLCQPQILPPLHLPLQWLLPCPSHRLKLSPSTRRFEKTPSFFLLQLLLHLLIPSIQRQRCPEVTPHPHTSRSKNAQNPRDAGFTSSRAPLFTSTLFPYGWRRKRTTDSRLSPSWCHCGRFPPLAVSLPLPLYL